MTAYRTMSLFTRTTFESNRSSHSLASFTGKASLFLRSPNVNLDLHNTFNGQVSITFSVLKPTIKVELASAVVLSSTVLRRGRQTIKILRNETDRNSRLTIFAAEKLVPKEEYTLDFELSYKMHPHSAIFVTEYLNPENENTSLVATSFDATRAREAFPCFDDPFFKATFNLTLIHPVNATVYSTEEVAESRLYGHLTNITRFKPTPKMSPHLFAFAIGDFVESKAVSESGVLVRAITTRNRQPSANSSAEMGASCVSALESLVSIKYPLKKLDHLDIGRYLSKHVESFGLNTDSAGLVAQFGVTLSDQVRQKMAICRRTALQWFGGLVTADRWGLEFLHESFATYFAIHAAAQVEEHRALTDVAELDSISSAAKNYRGATHAIVDNRSRFDSITNHVGSGVLNALRHILSDQVFYRGLTIYLRENAYKNANLDSLLRSWVQARGNNTLCGPITFTEYANDLFLRPGVPEVFINYRDCQFEISQRADKRGQKWNVPIFVLDLKTNTEHLLWLQKDGQICNQDDFRLAPDGEYIFNNEGKGFAEFLFSRTLMSKWIKNLKSHALSARNLLHNLKVLQKIGLWDDIDDLLSDLVVKKKGQIGFAEARYISQEHPKYNEIVRIISDNFDFKPTAENRLLGELFLETAVRRNISSVEEKAKRLFKGFKRDCAPEKELVECPRIPPEWRRAVYLQGLKKETGREFLERYGKRILSHAWSDFLKLECHRLATTF
uniref:Aminopeptidase n=1 Tax=Bursaphelenchus xylophilus TaxID=6326 RepID=A0A1I7SDK5_BURXY